jgi:hypothetical protein
MVSQQTIPNMRNGLSSFQANRPAASRHKRDKITKTHRKREKRAVTDSVEIKIQITISNVINKYPHKCKTLRFKVSSTVLPDEPQSQNIALPIPSTFLPPYRCNTWGQRNEEKNNLNYFIICWFSVKVWLPLCEVCKRYKTNTFTKVSFRFFGNRKVKMLT